MFLHLSIVFIIISGCSGVCIIECRSKDATQQLVNEYHSQCINETKVDPDLIKKIKKGDWKIPEEQLQRAKNWSLCVLMKAGLMSKQGVYNIDVALSTVAPEDREGVEMVIDMCLSKKAIPPQDIAFNFAKCYQKARMDNNYAIRKMNVTSKIP